MNAVGILIILYISSSTCEPFRNVSTFWHISDLYWNPGNNDNCSARLEECFRSLLNVFPNKNASSYPDFILWSSAGGPHMSAVSRTMNKTNSTMLVFPSLPSTKNIFRSKTAKNYRTAFQQASEWVDEASYETFWKGGYYSHVLKKPGNLRIIVLNTAMFCTFLDASEEDDPADQWKWLDRELSTARKERSKVYLLMSTTPGLASTADDNLFAPKHNRRYIEMVRSYSDVIAGQFGGYEVGDKFHIFYNKNVSCGWLMLAPPFYRSARLYMYDTNTLEPLDYVQLYKNDTTWHVQYRFSTFYEVPNISLFSLELLVAKMQKHQDLFLRYVLAPQRATYVFTRSEQCTGDQCSYNVLCNIMCVDYDAYNECITQNRNTGLQIEISWLLVVLYTMKYSF